VYCHFVDHSLFCYTVLPLNVYAMLFIIISICNLHSTGSCLYFILPPFPSLRRKFLGAIIKESLVFSLFPVLPLFLPHSRLCIALKIPIEPSSPPRPKPSSARSRGHPPRGAITLPLGPSAASPQSQHCRRLQLAAQPSGSLKLHPAERCLCPLSGQGSQRLLYSFMLIDLAMEARHVAMLVGHGRGEGVGMPAEVLCTFSTAPPLRGFSEGR
jgi:hypothetical protein